MIWGLTSRLSLMSMVSRSLCFAEWSEILPGGKLSLSISRVIIASVICIIFQLVVCFTASHCS